MNKPGHKRVEILLDVPPAHRAGANFYTWHVRKIRYASGSEMLLGKLGRYQLRLFQCFFFIFQCRLLFFLLSKIGDHIASSSLLLPFWGQFPYHLPNISHHVLLLLLIPHLSLITFVYLLVFLLSGASMLLKISSLLTCTVHDDFHIQQISNACNLFTNAKNVHVSTTNINNSRRQLHVLFNIFIFPSSVIILRFHWLNFTLSNEKSLLHALRGRSDKYIRKTKILEKLRFISPST